MGGARERSKLAQGDESRLRAKPLPSTLPEDELQPSAEGYEVNLNRKIATVGVAAAIGLSAGVAVGQQAGDNGSPSGSVPASECGDAARQLEEARGVSFDDFGPGCPTAEDIAAAQEPDYTHKATIEACRELLRKPGVENKACETIVEFGIPYPGE